MKEFIHKWSNWWILQPQRKELDEAFEKELNELIEREVALRQLLPFTQNENPYLDTDDWQTKQYNVEANTVTQCTGLKDKNGTPIFEGDFIKYTKHKGYMLPDFIAEVKWLNDSACFGYKRNDVPVWSSPTPFVEHDELQTDFLNYVEVVGNIWDNKIEELVAQHSI